MTGCMVLRSEKKLVPHWSQWASIKRLCKKSSIFSNPTNKLAGKKFKILGLAGRGKALELVKKAAKEFVKDRAAVDSVD